nr:MAG TPA: retinoblastoma-associated protein-like protein [Caudoviricetes sp.]
MYLIKVNENIIPIEFKSDNIEDSMVDLAKHIHKDANHLKKAMKGFANDSNKEQEYINIFNDLFLPCVTQQICAIYEIKEKWECNK